MTNIVLEKIKNIDSKDFKAVFVKCERCKRSLLIPVPKKPVLESENREVLITYVHKNFKKKDLHCLLFEVDHDFHIQLPKAADVIFSTHQNAKSKKSLVIKDVLISCDRCKETITVPVPEKLIKNSKIPKTPIAYIHNNKYGMDQHCVIPFLDSNFGDRATRLSDILIIHLFPFWTKKMKS